MAGTTTKLLLPYPTDTDLVTEGDEAIQALADRIEARLPWGWLAYAQVTANQTLGVGGDLTSLTVTLTLSASRRIRITGQTLVTASGTGNAAAIYIREGSTDLANVTTPVTNAWSTGFSIATHQSPSAGSHTYKLSYAFTGGTGTMNASAGAPAFISVEDIGPAVP